jgi:tetratricopeptide (TPR) repeat protein
MCHRHCLCAAETPASALSYTSTKRSLCKVRSHKAWVAVGLGAALACSNQVSNLERRCRESYAAYRWKEAVRECTKASAQDRPEMIILAAKAMKQNSQAADALALVERAFGTAADATARQIAGSLYEQRGDHTRARELLMEALTKHRAVGDHAEMSSDARWLVSIYLRENRLTDAIDTAQLCLTEAQKANDKRLEGYAHLAQADVFAAVGDEKSARRAFTEAASSLGQWPREVAWLLLRHGMFVRELGDNPSANKLLTEARTIAQQSGIAAVSDAATLNLAAIEAELGHVRAARQEFDALPETVRSTPAASYVAGLIAANPGGDTVEAERLFRICADDPPDDDYAWDVAFRRGQLAERSAPARAEQLYRDAIQIVETIRKRTPTLEIRPWILARRRAPYEALLVMLAKQGLGSSALEIAEQLHARTWLDAVATIAGTRASMSLPGDIVAAAPLSSDALLSLLGDREALVYVNAQGALWRMYVRGKQVVDLASVPDTVWSMLTAWRDRPDDLAIAEQLGSLLLPSKLAISPEPLYVVAPDRLANVPFAALRRSRRYLIEDRTLVRLPGLAARRCLPQATALGSPVLVADSHDDLSHARREVEHAVSVVGGQAYVGAEATVDRVAQARHARLLHAAVHSAAGASGGALDLADGRIAATDIIARGINPQVAILAGCGTSISHDDEGWGGLPSAFLVVGTRSVVATLHPVDDAHAASLMNTFYEQQGEQYPALALAKAQRTLARRAPPHAWAWFAAWGHAQPSECNESQSVLPSAAPM